MKYVYHGSNTGGLQTIEPKISTHGKKYVYAAQYPEVAIAFMSRANDLDFSWTRIEEGFCLIERYPEAFEKHFSGKSGYLYKLPADSFSAGMTSWNEELVSEESVLVISETFIPDLRTELLDLQQEGKIHIYLFDNQPDFIKELLNGSGIK